MTVPKLSGARRPSQKPVSLRPSSLPHGWERSVDDDSGCTYYHNESLADHGVT